MITIKSPREIETMAAAGRIVAGTLALVARHVRPGISTAALDRLAEDFIRSHPGARPSFKGLYDFPATLCTSINHEIVHGIPSPKRVLHDGDIVSVDFGVVIDGYYGDAAITVPVGQVDAERTRLLKVTEASLQAGIAAVKPGATLGDVGAAVQGVVEAEGFSVVRDFVGHGIGAQMHEDPQVPNYGQAGKGMKLRSGMVIAIEPMVNAGKPDVLVLDDGWTAVAKDGSMSAHFEHTVAVTDTGARILTE